MSCSIPNHERSEEFSCTTDPEGYYAEEWHAKSHGCICEWGFTTNPDKEPNCNWGHGWNHRIEEKANCPFHQVMY